MHYSLVLRVSQSVIDLPLLVYTEIVAVVLVHTTYIILIINFNHARRSQLNCATLLLRHLRYRYVGAGGLTACPPPTGHSKEPHEPGVNDPKCSGDEEDAPDDNIIQTSAHQPSEHQIVTTALVPNTGHPGRPPPDRTADGCRPETTQCASANEADFLPPRWRPGHCIGQRQSPALLSDESSIVQERDEQHLPVLAVQIAFQTHGTSIPSIEATLVSKSGFAARPVFVSAWEAPRSGHLQLSDHPRAAGAPATTNADRGRAAAVWTRSAIMGQRSSTLSARWLL